MDTRDRTCLHALVATLDDLWGSTVRSMGFDPTARVVTLIARVTDAGVTTPFMLRLCGVSELRVERPDGESWDYTEITEAHAAASSHGLRCEPGVLERAEWSDGPLHRVLHRHLSTELP